MPERIAIKVLTGSDLTFFDTFYRRSNITNQKAINLNKDVFADQLYPDFAEKSSGQEVEVPVSVAVFGPRPGKPYRFARSITKKQKYKNWRLNGAAVPDPEGEKGRFDELVVGDLAVIEFLGDAAPNSVRMVIVSSEYDPQLHGFLKSETPGGKKTMTPVSRSRLAEIASTAGAAPDHPIQALLPDTEAEKLLEQAHLGLEPAIRRLRERSGRRMTKEDLANARERAERVGSDGEVLASILLNSLVAEGRFPDIEWTSSDDAVASWDFETRGDPHIRFDAKATTGAFDTPFHLSDAESVAASSEEIPYRIIRISELTEDRGTARISEDINDLARAIQFETRNLPDGVRTTGFVIEPKRLKWGEPIPIERPDEPENGFTPQP